ncbi:MAG: ABC transporter permease [Armatimonadetes bacterium]|nr:ABC transporter permease [Armatimonadota bacterium]
MVALGVAFLIGSYSVYENLAGSYEGSYRKLGFEDFSVRFNSAPERIVNRIAQIPGVTAVEGRLVEETALELSKDTSKKMLGRLIGMPVDRELKVNRLHITKGRMPQVGFPEVLLESAFAKHHELKPGDYLIAVRQNSRLSLRIAGIVQSDEYLYVVRSKQDIVAMPDTFGVLFMDENVLGALFQKSGQINEIHCTTAANASLEKVMDAARSVLIDSDPEDPIPRKEQPSYQMLQQDVRGFRMYAVLFPMLFLGAAAVSVYSMLNRFVRAQRPEIGLFRSLGLSPSQIVGHFLSGSILIGVVGSFFGVLLGIWLGNALSRYYMSQVQVPFPEIIPRLGVTTVGSVVGVAVCMVSAWLPAIAASRIGPAEAMRPVTPSFGRQSLRLDALLPGLPMMARIPLRNVFRQPRRTVSTLIGVVSGMCLMITASGLLDSMNVAINQLLSAEFGYDLRADFYDYQSKRVVQTVRSWSGINWAEGVLELPMEFRFGKRSYSALLNGIEPGSRLVPLVGFDGKPMKVSEEGAIFGPTLRSQLKLKVGDTVQIALPEYLTKDKSTTKEVKVVGFCDEAIGTQVYMPRWQLETLFRADLDLPGNAITGILIVADPLHKEMLRKRLLNLPRVASAISAETMRTMVTDLIKTSSRFVRIMELFGAALAFATIFNMISMNVLERQSEVATLRTLGVSRKSIGLMIAAENLVVAVIGVAIGLPVGREFVKMFWAASMTEEQQNLFSFSVVILPFTYVQAAVAIILVTLLSLPPSIAYLNRIDLARAFKERTN